MSGLNSRAEDNLLVKNVNDQLCRLVQQIHDLEECKEDMTEDEYNESKDDTREQLIEFETSLAKMSKGDLSLTDSLGSVRLAIRAAISQAFQTPDVIKLFAAKQTGGLRQKLDELERDFKIGKIPADSFTSQKLEILVALKRLDEDLSTDDAQFFESHSTKSMKQFVQVNPEDSVIEDSSKILAIAKK